MGTTITFWVDPDYYPLHNIYCLTLIFYPSILFCKPITSSKSKVAAKLFQENNDNIITEYSIETAHSYFHASSSPRSLHRNLFPPALPPPGRLLAGRLTQTSSVVGSQIGTAGTNRREMRQYFKIQIHQKSFKTAGKGGKMPGSWWRKKRNSMPCGKFKISVPSILALVVLKNK